MRIAVDAKRHEGVTRARGRQLVHLGINLHAAIGTGANREPNGAEHARPRALHEAGGTRAGAVADVHGGRNLARRLRTC